MKRVISLILVGAIVLGFVAMIGFEVFADPIDETQQQTVVQEAEEAAPAPEAEQEEIIDDKATEKEALKQKVLKAHATRSYGVYWIELGGLPYEITAGSTDVPEVEVWDGDVVVADVKWVNTNKQPVTKLENNKAYYLAVFMKTADGYVFDEEPRIWVDEHDVVAIDILDDTNCVAYFYYSLLPKVEDIAISINDPYVGMDVSQLTLTVDSGEAELEKIIVCDEGSGTELKQGKLQQGKTYGITYILRPEEGYDFEPGYTGIDKVNGANNEDISWYFDGGMLYFNVYFSTATVIERVDLTLTGMTVGAVIEDTRLTAADSAPFTVEYYNVYEWNVEEEFENFRDIGRYELSYEVYAKDGYRFTEETEVYVNGELIREPHLGSTMLMINGWQDYQFLVHCLDFTDLPTSVEAGPVQDVDEVALSSSTSAKVVDAQWVNTNKQPVTVLEDGKTYYLAVTLKATGVAYFVEGKLIDVSVSDTGSLKMREMKRISDKEIVVYIPYALLPPVGQVDITVTGLEAGKNIADVKATVAGNAVVDNVTINERFYDEEIGYSYEEVTTGKVKEGTFYWVSVELSPKSGYRFMYDYDVTVNGDFCYNWYCDDEYMSVEAYLNTCSKISSVALTIPTVSVGKSIKDLTVTAEKNAKYILSYNWWDDTEDKEASGKIQKGHEYYLHIELHAKAGYAFARDVKVTLNGKAKDVYGTGSGEYIDFSSRYAFLTAITEVKLPAMPKSITLGQTLPTNFTVSSSANYTISANWYKADEYSDDVLEVADQKGVYVLTLYATPKAGYEFTDKTKVYVDGKQVSGENMGVGSDYAYVYKQYIVGLTELKKAEINVATPDVGAPPAATIPAGQKYTIGAYAWAQNNDGDFFKDYDIVTSLAKGKYTYLGVLLTAAEDYAFGEDVTFYLNGKVVTPILKQLDGTGVVAFFAMGKLGEFPKLDAPKISVSGETISWNSVLNADAYEIYRATSKSGKYAKVDTVTATSWADSADGKTYYYKVKAISYADSSKNSGYSNAVSVTFKLDVPVVSIQNATSGKPQISWEKVSGASKYTIYRSTSETGKYSKLGTSKTTSYTDSKAKAGTTYFYKVVANGSKSSFDSGLSEYVSCGVICGTPTVTVKIDANTGKPVLSWKKVDGAAKYAIYRDGQLLAEQTALTYTDKAAAINVEYCYYVQALGKTEDLNGNNSKEVYAAAGLAKPTVKGSVDAVEGKPVLTWEAVEGAVKYEIYRSTKSNKSYSLLATVETLTYTDTSVAAGKTYYYQVKAVGEISKSANSSYVKLTGKLAAPEAEVTLNVTSGKPVITWEKVSGAKKYTVYRSTSETSGYKSIGTSKTTSYTDSKAVPGTTYFYKVVANASSSKYNSAYSQPTVGIVGYAAAPQVTLKNDSKGKPVVSWKKVSEAERYIVGYVDVTDLEDESQLTEEYALENGLYVEVSKKKTSVTLTGAETGRIYAVIVVAVPKNEQYFNYSELGFVASTCATPKLKATYKYQNYNGATWSKPDGVEYYLVYRSTNKSKGFVLLGELDAGYEGFYDTSAVKGKTYYYKVVACTEYTESAFSNVVKIKTKK